MRGLVEQALEIARLGTWEQLMIEALREYGGLDEATWSSAVAQPGMGEIL